VQHQSHLRFWRDLSKLRLLFGLAFAPLLSIALGATILWTLGQGVNFLWLGSVLAAAEIWSMLIGTVFLTIARRRGIVRRAYCLLLGAFLACSLPSAVYLTSKTVDWAFTTLAPTDPDDAFNEGLDGPSDGAFVVILSVTLIPFGTLGGWVFWRLGVWPARPKVIDVAPVFD
jgi:hypothetical protein